MIEAYVRNVIEAALLAAGRPLTMADLGQLFDASECPDPSALSAALEQLGAEYAERGIELKQTASGWRVQVRREFAAEVSRLWPERPARYSRALLETLALIAYRQPITRGEIEDVRGVAVNPNIIKTLLERNWIRVVGQRDVPGRPELLGTTREFLDYFGLVGLDDLPPLSELKALTEPNLQLDLPAGAAVPGAEQASGSAAGEDASAEVAPSDAAATPSDEPAGAEPPLDATGEGGADAPDAGPSEPAEGPQAAPGRAAEPVQLQSAAPQAEAAVESEEHGRGDDRGVAPDAQESLPERIETAAQPPEPDRDAPADPAAEAPAEAQRSAVRGALAVPDGEGG